MENSTLEEKIAKVNGRRTPPRLRTLCFTRAEVRRMMLSPVDKTHTVIERIIKLKKGG